MSTFRDASHIASYALTEEQEEQRLISKFDPFDLWTPEVQEVGLDLLRLAAVKLEDFKKRGNQAFKAAFLYYQRAKA